MTDIETMFSDPQAVAKYTEGPPRFVPGYNAMLSMAAILLAERAPENAQVLVLGAGGGLELKAFAEAHQGWSFDGVDPSVAMLGSPGKPSDRVRTARVFIRATSTMRRKDRSTAPPAC